VCGQHRDVFECAGVCCQYLRFDRAGMDSGWGLEVESSEMGRMGKRQ